MSKKLFAAFMALAAFAAFAVSATSASAVSLQAPTGTTLANGTALKGVNVGETLMTSLSEEVLVRCSSVVQEGTIVSNGPTTITGDITSAVFKGSATGGACTAAFGTSAVVTTTLDEGEKQLGVPYCLKTIAETDKFEVRGGKCSEASRPIKFTLDFSDGGTCGFEKANLTGTFTTDVSGQEATMTTDKEGNFKRYETNGKGFSSFLCPTETQLDMTFKLQTGAGATVYVR